MLYNVAMKKRLIYVAMSLSMAFSLATPLAVQATSLGRTSYSQTESTLKSNSTDSATTTTSTTSQASTTPAAMSDDSAGRSSRLENYKKNLKEALTATLKARIVERCVAAQAIVKGRVTSNDAITIARETAYDEIIGNLQSVVTTASEQNVDVTALQANISVLQAKIVSFKAANSTYHQALSDLGAVDCKTDPTAFKGALEAARADQLAIFTSAKDIRSYLNDTVKVTLKALKTKLNSQSNL